ncbi:sugar transferase, partial [Streptomyces sp. SID3915]|nr:sugar transferase [Streptomyces sp. SID3915]
MKRAVRGTWRPAAPGAAPAPLREALSAAADALA